MSYELWFMIYDWDTVDEGKIKIYLSISWAGCYILVPVALPLPRLDYQALARASILLGVDVNLEDNHKLYLEAADWIGVPYRGGGDSKRGTDCSGAGLSSVSKGIPHPSATQYRGLEKRK